MMRNSICGGSMPVIDPVTQKKNIKYFLDVKIISRNSKIYSTLLVLSLFEPMLLQFLPWWKTELSIAAEFPTLGIMSMVFGFKFTQLLVTFGGQVCILLAQKGHYNSTFGAIAILNVAFTSLTLAMKGFEMVVKRGILKGSTMSDDCEAARKASGIEGESSNSITNKIDESAIELGSIYGENPMHAPSTIERMSASAANTSTTAEDTSSLLVSIQATMQEQTRRLDKQDLLLHELRSRGETNAAETPAPITLDNQTL